MTVGIHFINEEGICCQFSRFINAMLQGYYHIFNIYFWYIFGHWPTFSQVTNPLRANAYISQLTIARGRTLRRNYFLVSLILIYGHVHWVYCGTGKVVSNYNGTILISTMLSTLISCWFIWLKKYLYIFRWVYRCIPWQSLKVSFMVQIQPKFTIHVYVPKFTTTLIFLQ